MGQQQRFTIWLEPAVFEAARERAERGGLSLSVVLAEAAKESLLSSYRGEREAELLKAVERVCHKVGRLEKRQNLDHQLLKEMVGLAVLSFFNHTPAIPEAEKKAALLSGKMRFHRYLDVLAGNLRAGASILSDVPNAGTPGLPAPGVPIDQDGAGPAADGKPAPPTNGIGPPGAPPADGHAGSARGGSVDERLPASPTR